MIRSIQNSGIRGEVIYYSPEGKKFKQYPEVLRFSFENFAIYSFLCYSSWIFDSAWRFIIHKIRKDTYFHPKFLHLEYGVFSNFDPLHPYDVAQFKKVTDPGLVGVDKMEKLDLVKSKLHPV